MSYGNGGTIPGYGQALSAPQASSPVSPVNNQTNALVDRVNAIHNLIAELEARLMSVLLPEPPSKDSTGLSASGAGSLSGMLGLQNDRLSAACGRLQSVVNRLEL